MRITMHEYAGYPCTLEDFEINGIKAFEEDFGDGGDNREDIDEKDFNEDIVKWGCCNRVFKRDESKREKAMKVYGLSSDEFDQVCSKLEEKLSIRECGWCV